MQMKRMTAELRWRIIERKKPHLKSRARRETLPKSLSPELGITK